MAISPFKKYLGWTLEVAGWVLLPVFTAATFYLNALGCAMNTTGCNVSAQDLFARLVFSWDAWWFWAVLLLLAGMIGLGRQCRKATTAR